MQIVSMFIKRKPAHERNERGAALITTLLMSMLLLSAGGALILTTAMSATNAYDSTAETQAYYAAEAGMQATLNVLRGNVSPNIDYRIAVTPSASNAAGDTATTQATPFARLSNWLAYDANFTDRVALSSPYTPLNGSAFNVVLSDPDSTSTVKFTTSGTFPTSTNADKSTITASTPGNNWATISYNAQASTTLTAYPSIASLLGSFQTSVNKTGGTFPANTPFTLTINQTAPWAATIVINCTFGGTITSTTSSVDMTFPSLGYENNGALYKLGSTTQHLDPPGTNAGLKQVSVTVTAPQPKRILVRVNGYGPRGSRKQMEMMVGRLLFEYSPQSLIAIRSADDNISPMTFDDGSSAAHAYSGNDNGGHQTSIPAFAVTSAVDALKLTTLSGTVTGTPRTSQVPVSSLSSWLQTADAARTELIALENAAKAENRYFTSAAPPDSYGTTTNPLFTFVNGDCNPGDGAGMVVCTGTVNFNGRDGFNGLILALGGGSLVRSGGGSGTTLGAVVVARFDRNNWGGPFLAPTFNTNGGGNSDVLYDTSWVDKALRVAGRFTRGVSEY